MDRLPVADRHMTLTQEAANVYHYQIGFHIGYMGQFAGVLKEDLSLKRELFYIAKTAGYIAFVAGIL